MASHDPLYDLTFYSADGGSAVWGSASSGAITEPSFQTPHPTISHDRPYLILPRAFSAAEVDFLTGKANLGEVSVGVLDRRTDSTDQTSGLVTAELRGLVGRRAVLRRWVPEISDYVVRMDGVVSSFKVDQDDVVTYWFGIRDTRSFGQGEPMFSSNYVLWGYNGRSGPGANYGRFPALKNSLFGSFDDLWMLTAVDPYQSISTSAGLDHFERLEAASPDDGIYYGYSAVYAENSGDTLSLPDLGWPELGDDGLYHYNDVWIRWRPVGTSTWTELHGMPRAEYRNIIDPGYTATKSAGLSALPAIYFGSTDPDDLPSTGEDVEFQVLAEKITEDTPFWWDNGTLGDLLDEILSGEHTDEVPEDRYDASDLIDFQASSVPARFILTSQVTDRKKWMEVNIFQPSLAAPALTINGAVSPTSWELPKNTDSVDELDADSMVPVGDYGAEVETAVRKVSFTYIREHLDEKKTVLKKRAKKFLGITYSTKYEEVVEDSRMDWERLVQTEVELTETNADAPPGARTVEFKPITIRSIAGVDGAPPSGNIQNELGRRIFKRLVRTIFDRFTRPCPRLEIEVAATAMNLQIATGKWLRVPAEWLPDYDEGVRDMRRYMQVYGVADHGPDRILLKLEDGGRSDPTADSTTVDPDGDCLTGGTLYAAPDGRSIRILEDGDYLTNSCSEAKTVTLLLLGGGGAGERSQGGTGGAAGGSKKVTVTIGPGESIPITGGQGGVAGASVDGKRVIWWGDAGGNALDPLSDDYHDGEYADGGDGGGGTNASGNGYAGGGGCSTGVGGGTCSAEAGGGGGGAQGDGTDSSCSSAGAEGGSGGVNKKWTQFGVHDGEGGSGGAYYFAGDCAGWSGSYDLSGLPGDGWGAGGGGGSAATDGGKGAVMALYAGAQATLTAPPISSTTVTSDNRMKVCVDDADWPTIVPTGYRVRVRYAYGDSGDSRPAADSGDWQIAGYLEEPGCIYTGAVPTGAKVWTQVRAEADQYLPTADGGSGSEAADTTTEYAGLLLADLQVDKDTGIGTVTWTANPYTDQVEVRALRHDGESVVGESDTVLVATIDAADGTYELAGLGLSRGQYLTVDLQATGTHDAPDAVRLTVQRPEQTLATVSAGSGASIAGGDNLTFDDDLGLVVDDNLDLVTDD